MKKTKIGVIGCGMISDTYFNAAKRFRNIEIVGCSDIIPERSKAKAETYNIKQMTNDEIFNSPEIELVVNLTPPKVHTEIALGALQADKHTYSEKPFGVDMEDALKVRDLAQAKGLRVGCAPDTFLGGGQQTARKLLDDGWIGKVLSGTAIVAGRGPEKWGQAPFFYDYGAGPMLDLGPYYCTTLVNMLGPAKSVTAVTTKGFDYRTYGAEVAEQYQSQYKPFDRYPVNVTTHLTGVIEFHSGAVITMLSSFDVYQHNHNPIELYGSEGSMIVPDPNTFGGPVKVYRREWQWAEEPTGFREVPIPFGYCSNSRSIGASDMAMAITNNRPHRASGSLALHVLELMLAFDKSSKTGAKVELTTTCERPAPLPLGLEDGEIDE
ncbi:MAG: Gfo/Idh/MocA family oxidoreductase [Lentisphaeria bacterium]|nr:Gfo/Idh/MocA family oxidoreductase [Lentisphaeria bacterium]